MDNQELNSIKAMALNYSDPIRGKLLGLIAEIESLQLDKAALIEVLEWYAAEKTYKLGVQITMGSAFPLHEPIKEDKGARARLLLTSLK